MLKRIIVFTIMLFVITILFGIFPALGLEDVLNNACQGTVTFWVAIEITFWIFKDKKTNKENGNE